MTTHRAFLKGRLVGVFGSIIILVALVLAEIACSSSSDTMETSRSMEDTPIIHMPVQGTWKLVKSPGHDRFAFDLVAADDESRRTSRKSRLQHILGRASADDSYSWSMPVYAPLDGVVVRAHDGSPDRQQLSLLKDLWTMIFSRPKLNPEDISPFAGNHVIMQGDDFYVFLAHMQCGSLQVTEGDKVEVGQRIGRVGNSGFTLEPHLHFQLFDRIDDLLAATAPPFLVNEYERWTGERWEMVSNAVLQKGDLVRYLQGA